MLLFSTMNFTLWSVSNQRAVVLILMFISDWLRIQMSTLCVLKKSGQARGPDSQCRLNGLQPLGMRMVEGLMQ